MPDDDLVRVLSEIQRRGAIGRTPLPDAIAHADRFVRALPPTVRWTVDLGSGGGLPGLVIASRRRDVRVTLIERRAKRVDLLRYGIRVLQLADSATVVEADAAAFGLSLGPATRADAVTARSFGPPLQVLEVAARIVRPTGVVLISEPPSGMPAWSVDDLATRGFADDGSIEGIRRFVRLESEPSV
jgi:16S rRNA (guanine527-N7)-methyltransferase